jgi:glycosyltransferase involved in cell wall biosynthesis
MRVAHVIKVTRISGAERHLLVLLKGLRDANIDAHLIILTEYDTPMDDMMSEAAQRDIPIQRLVIHRDYDMRILWRLRQCLREIQPNVVHTHLIHADVFGWVASKLAGIKTVIASRHNDDAFRYHSVLRQVSRVLWWLTDGGIAISDAIRNFTITVEGASPQKIHLIRYGLEYRWISDGELTQAQHALRKELDLPDSAIILGMVCRLVEQKGIPYALQAFARLQAKFPDVHLVIVGDGELADELNAQAQDLKLKQIHWLGWRADAQELMGAFDIFLMPSLWEGFGLVLLEAMSRRIPIVASGVSAIPEVVEHQQTGLLVAPKHVEQLETAIESLIVDRPLRKHMGLLGEDRLEQVFSVHKMVEQTIQVYQQYLR